MMILIQKAERQDLPAILALQYAAFQEEARLVHSDNIPPLTQTPEEIAAEWEQGVMLKAVDEAGQIVGSVRGKSEQGIVTIGKLIVHPDKQGQGIGSSLLLGMEARYPHQRYELFTRADNPKTVSLYQRLGYRPFREEQVSPTLRFVYMEK